jgi:hypothetical protein
MKIIQFLIVVMLFLSLFIPVPSKSGWDFLFMFEFYEAPRELIEGHSLVIVVLWPSLLVVHILIVKLLYQIKNPGFKKRLIFIPLLFLAVYSLISPIFFFCLIPFTFFWILSILAEWRIRNYGTY